ncbi:MAG: hypothetical protein LBV70_01780 [Candidatus Adiutrix sp.]|jgi:hypothetical protein|nr:hypothetical protein [Candidatus Adiutrix sp.]
MTDMDPIEEIHRIRKKLYAEAGGNPAAYALSLRAIQGEGGRKVVSLNRPARQPAGRRKAMKEQLLTIP